VPRRGQDSRHPAPLTSGISILESQDPTCKTSQSQKPYSPLQRTRYDIPAGLSGLEKQYGVLADSCCCIAVSSRGNALIIPLNPRYCKYLVTVSTRYQIDRPGFLERLNPTTAQRKHRKKGTSLLLFFFDADQMLRCIHTTSTPCRRRSSHRALRWRMVPEGGEISSNDPMKSTYLTHTEGGRRPGATYQFHP
jgi:hypothetical protein